MLRFRPRYLKRYRRIADVLVRHGFGALVAQLGLDQALDFRQRLAPDPEQPVTRKTAAVHLREAIEELGPTFIKFGQIASTRPDMFPPEFIDELAGLQDNIPPAPWNEIQAAIEAELGRPLAELFLVVDPTPIASASLGQVYAALLPDRTEVIVKVQRPNIEQTIETDLGILADLARLAQERLPAAAAMDPVGIVREFSESLRGELDYRGEARNADRFRANFAKEKYIYVPKVYWEYTTRHVEVQERIRGIKINDYPALTAAGYDRDRIAMNAAKAIIKEVLVDGFFHADPHPGNLLILPGEVIGLIDFGLVGTLDRTDRAQLVRLWSSIIGLDAEGAADQLLRMGIAGPQTDQVGLTRALRRHAPQVLRAAAEGDRGERGAQRGAAHHLRVQAACADRLLALDQDPGDDGRGRQGAVAGLRRVRRLGATGAALPGQGWRSPKAGRRASSGRRWAGSRS